MPTLESIIKQKVGRLETVPTKFEKMVFESQKKIFDDILSLLDKLERSNGSIVMSSNNLLIVDEIAAETKKVILGGEYTQAVKEFAGEFDQQAIINSDYFDKAFGTFTETELAAQILTSTKTIAVEAMIGSVDNNFVLPLKDLLTKSVSSGSSWVDMVKEIKEFAEGGKEVDGKLLRYAKQIASDTFATSDRSYTNAIVEDSDYVWFLYSGGVIGGTRIFCDQRNDRYYHKKEIEKWADIEKWDGKVKGTDEKSIFIYAGGYNCKHSILPVSILLVPKLDIQRNIKNGNFIPSDFEKKELNL